LAAHLEFLFHVGVAVQQQRSGFVAEITDDNRFDQVPVLVVPYRPPVSHEFVPRQHNRPPFAVLRFRHAAGDEQTVFVANYDSERGIVAVGNNAGQSADAAAEPRQRCRSPCK
jgi:hypothetical protein